MKVTVCFGKVRVVVPCGNGELLVRDLKDEAIRRYKKAAGKHHDSFVTVHNLQTQSGILDPDDRVNDVADDKEQILACFEDDPGVPQGGGDGASGSSVGTGSPDIFRGPPDHPKYDHTQATPHIEVTSTGMNNLSNGLGLLQVRRSSDPSLHQIGLDPRGQTIPSHLANQHSDHNKRWSAAPVCRSDQPERHIPHPSDGSNAQHNGFLSPSWEDELEEPQPESIPNQFSRSGRLSMQFLGADATGFKWADAAEKAAATAASANVYASKSLPRETKRKEPLGQAYESIREKNGEMLLIVNENGGPLGLTAVPDIENGGLLVQHVEVGGRAERGRLRRGDRILEINGIKLVGLSEGSVQDHLRRSCSAPELRLRVMRASTLVKRLQKEISEMIEAEEKSSSTKVATVSPTKKLPGGSGTLQASNTRKLGRKIEISLRKGPHGLGFSVTTRDNPAGGHCPIYIKTILPRGAAIVDGRLKPGDRLLEVDGVPMTGLSQTDVVQKLRSTLPDATVDIVVSRQMEVAGGAEHEQQRDEREIGYCENETDNTTPPKPPAPIFPQKSSLKKSAAKSLVSELTEHFIEAGSESASSSESSCPPRNREILTLHIPVHDTEKAGLGVSVKGKTGSNNSSSGSIGSASKHDGDLGIFVKSVLNGGAASRDGRLNMNDQLLNVNGISLLGQSNAEAMETLRKAMLQTGGKFPGMISLTISRRIGSNSSTRPNSMIDSFDFSHTRSISSTSEQSGKTVIYLSSDKLDKHCDEKAETERDGGKTSNRWSNPVLDRLTGGTGHMMSGPPIPPQKRQKPSPASLLAIQHQQHAALRNESYYMATNETWSPNTMLNHHNHINNSVLIEEDPEPMTPTLPPPNHMHRSLDTSGQLHMSSSQNGDVTYDSQLSLETNPPVDTFSRDAIGRRSMSEKHHAALDAKETGTYQRNKKLREQRERERDRRVAHFKKGSGSSGGPHAMGSMESLASAAANEEAQDRVGELGPSLGLKKSSSLESLQTMVQEIQMSDEPRGPSALRTPRGRGREESLRAAVERPSENKPRKTWLLEDGPSDTEGGFINRNGPFQSSLNEGSKSKAAARAKKPSLLKGIGHMFRFGKHRKDGIAPTETVSDVGPATHSHYAPLGHPQPIYQTHAAAMADRPPGGPPNYQPPPPVSNGVPAGPFPAGSHPKDLTFNHRYSQSLYVNHNELQHQIGPQTDLLSESTIAQMRHQVMQQRVKVEEESRRNQHYHSQRSQTSRGSKYDLPLHTAMASPPMHPPSHNQPQVHMHHQPPPAAAAAHPPPPQTHHKPQRPASSYYEYETLQKYQVRKNSAPSSPLKLNGSLGSSGRHRGPYVTQVTIQNAGPPPNGHNLPYGNHGSQPHHPHHQGQAPHPASKV